ncbi:glycosyltransferase [Gloeobacter violaceus]|uniref:Glr3790 protein n=1 Tax=Gloeobacter violaceus (strain ATCC 29082 / PCC 7421) TaxID=251221 RepID=Q7NET8_GLOVI|nr:glycosyltransferase family 2 protein [Gloeobacter violaceus]BAC91731.1 glr3790 [Gloeobacter violaceus PCC 7421]
MSRQPSLQIEPFKEITFVIVTYNSAKTLTDSIESCLQTIHHHYGSRGRLVVVDNASLDSCSLIVDHYHRAYPDIFIGINSSNNLGFGKANNLAVEYFPSQVYALINPDVVFQPETILKLHGILVASRDVAIVCPKLLYPDHTVQPSVRTFPTFTYFLLRSLIGEKLQRKLYSFSYYYEHLYNFEIPCEVDWGIGAFMMVSGDYISKYGLFDERFFLYFEDVNLCLNAWRNGFRVLFDPQATAIHKYQRASTRSPFNYLRLLHTVSAFKFFTRHPELLY